MALSWIFDLQLGMARLFGQLCSAALDSRKGRYNRPGKQSPFPHLSLHKIGSAASKMANMMNRVKLLFFASVIRRLDSAIHLKNRCPVKKC